MIETETVIAILERNITLLKKLDGHKLAGFAIVCPPDGESTEVLDMAFHSDVKSFYTSLSDKFKSALEQSQLGGVRMAPDLGNRR